MSLHAENVTGYVNDARQEVAIPRVEVSKIRLFFIDHLRVILTMLVIIHHLAITYGAEGPWYFHDPSFGTDLPATLVLTLLICFNQAFFMSCFFMIAGYFTPGSYERKGVGTFLKDRLIRLGIPLVICAFLLLPLISFLVKGGSISSFGAGPLWFVETLLLFAGGYILWRWLTREQVVVYKNTPPTALAIFCFTLIVAAITFLVRTILSMDVAIPLLGLRPASFPQYISLFIVGVIAYRRNWFQNIPSWMGKVGLGMTVIATLFLLPLAFIGIDPQSTEPALLGGLNWQAGVYALWETIVCVGMCIGLPVLFRQKLNKQSHLGTFLSNHAYTVYIIHTPAIVGLAFALGPIALNPLLKFGIATLISIPLCFACSYLVRKLPSAQKVL